MKQGPVYIAGLIGCGRIGSNTNASLRQTLPKGWIPLSHAEAIQSNPRLRLAGICDPVESQLRDASARLGVSACFDHHSKLIEELSPVILSVATRTAGRCEIVRAACVAGVKGLHVEKPLGRSIKESEDAISVAREHGVKMSYGTTRRYMEIYRLAAEMVSSGEIGELIQITVEHGRGSLLWHHPHSVDLILFFGNAAGVESIQSTCSMDRGNIQGLLVDEDPIVESAAIKLDNGVVGTVSMTGGMSVRLSGTKGTLAVVGDGSYLEIRRDGRTPGQLSTETVHISPASSGTQRAFQELVAAIDRGGDAFPAEHILLSQKILFGCVYSSIERGARVKLSEVPPELTVTGRSGNLYA